MKKILGAGLVLLVLGAAFMVWRASQDTPAPVIEEKYLTDADQYLDLDGGRVRVRIEGPADGVPVLLIHGFSHSLETWDAWAETLNQDYRVIRYDLFGHGLTGPDPKERYSPDERAGTIGDILDALEIKSAVIAGNSLGGLAAWKYAVDHAERVRALILISPGAFALNGVSDEPADIPAAVKAYFLTAPPAAVRASAGLIYADADKITDHRVTVMTDMINREGNGAAMIKSLEEFTLPDPTQALAALRVPVLILWGAADGLIPVEQGRRMVQIVPDAELIEYPGVGHAAQEEAPAQSVADAIAFIEQHGAEPASDAP